MHASRCAPAKWPWERRAGSIRRGGRWRRVEGDGGGFVGGRVADGAGGARLESLGGEVGERADAFAPFRMGRGSGEQDALIAFGGEEGPRALD